MSYMFDSYIDRKASLSVKWNKEAIQKISGNPEAVPFWVADMDFQVAPEIRSEAIALAEHGIFGYPNANNQRQVFCTWAKNRHHMDVKPSQVVISGGVLNSISMLTELLSDESDAVIVPMPAYQPFVGIVNRQHRTLLEWPLLYDKNNHIFSMDWEAFERLCTKAKILIFCNPHNPSGLVFSKAELTRLCNIAKEHQVLIISDEIHADLSFTEHVSVLEVAQETGCEAVVCMAPSKTFNIAGEHYSVTLFNNQVLREQFTTRLDQLYLSGTSNFATTIALTAYEKGLPYIQALLQYLQETATSIETFLETRIPSIHFIRPEASFIALLDCSEILNLVEADAKANPGLYNPSLSPYGGLLSRFFGQRASIAVNDGTWFGGEDYRFFVRFNFGTPKANVIQALHNIEQAVKFLQETYAN
ncbi:MAG: aminotransferase class I/II-fold pyridoxal phosphate-dependent enzyme [Spirochaetia bacterium]|nr:aminotransferase class I/II-fold pyridoxal phosphate-dependent enzyme [Spirochaetia bacterium]